MRKIPMMITAILFTLTLLPGLAAAAGEDYEHHALLRYWLATPADEQWFQENSGRLDIATGKMGVYLDLVVPLSKVGETRAAGSRVEVLDADMEQSYAERNGDRTGDRSDFGVYHTFGEVVAWMDTLRNLYPNVISQRWSLGQGHNGNQIWAFRLSDNPNADESGEPEVLFDGMHHAREIMASEFPMMLAEYLCEEYYAGNPDIVPLVDANEIYFVPIVNPDGLLYNEQIAPNGGGMWRKNRRDNGGGVYGVDVNRNYPYQWGCNDGSSGNPGDETYRGPTPGSEPETQALMNFINAHAFLVRQSYHTYGELTLYPWGYTTSDTPDEAMFREMAAAMVQYNGYTPGQPGEVLYPVCGGTFDWDYGAQGEHDKIFGFTNEMGTSFWPSGSERIPMFNDNLWPALYLVQIAGSLRSVTWIHEPLPFTAELLGSYSLSGVPIGFEAAPIVPGSVKLRYRVDGGAFVEVTMMPTGNPSEYGASIPAQVAGSVVEYYLEATDTGGNTGTSPRMAPSALHYFEVGDEFAHDMEADRGWGVGDVGDDAGSGIWVRVDPVGTLAQPENDHSPDGTQCWITGQHVAGQTIGYNDVDGGKTTLMSPVYDMTGAQELTFSYWRWYSNDQGSAPGEDFWDVWLSNDAGATWTQIEHTQVSAASWQSHAYDLFDYFAQPGLVQLKFVASDEINGSVVEAGVDDFLIAGVFDATGTGDSPVQFQLSLAQNFPNPFNPKTTIRFRLPEAGTASLAIYDAQGRLVRSLLNGELVAGDHALSWNGSDALGRPVASGSYFARLKTAEGERSCRMLLVK